MLSSDGALSVLWNNISNEIKIDDTQSILSTGRLPNQIFRVTKEENIQTCKLNLSLSTYLPMYLTTYLPIVTSDLSRFIINLEIYKNKALNPS